MKKKGVILAVDDDEESRAWAQYVHLGRPVLVSNCKTAWDTITRLKGQLFSVLINIENYEKGLALAVFAVEAYCLYAGVMSSTVPDALHRAPFVMNQWSLVVLQQDDGLVLEDGVTDWVTFYESIRFLRHPSWGKPFLS